MTKKFIKNQKPEVEVDLEAQVAELKNTVASLKEALVNAASHPSPWKNFKDWYNKI